MRLNSSSGLSSTGRLEVQYNGTWGTVCSHGFTLTDANLVCKLLGFATYNTFSSNYGKGSGPIWLSNVKCKGRESNIALCAHNGWGVHTCTHQQDIGITCYDGELNIRLKY